MKSTTILSALYAATIDVQRLIVAENQDYADSVMTQETFYHFRLFRRLLRKKQYKRERQVTKFYKYLEHKLENL